MALENVAYPLMAFLISYILELDVPQERLGKVSPANCRPPALTLTPSLSDLPQGERTPIIPSENVLTPDGSYSPVVKELLNSAYQTVTDVEGRSRAQSVSSVLLGTPRKYTHVRHRRAISHGSAILLRRSSSRRSLASLGANSQRESPLVRRSHSGTTASGTTACPQHEDNCQVVDKETEHHQSSKRAADNLSLGSLGRRSSRRGSQRHRGRDRRGNSLSLDPSESCPDWKGLDGREHSGSEGDCESDAMEDTPDIHGHVPCFSFSDDPFTSEQSDLSSFTVSSSTNQTQPNSENSTFGSYVLIHSPVQSDRTVTPSLNPGCRLRPVETATPSRSPTQNHSITPSPEQLKSVPTLHRQSNNNVTSSWGKQSSPETSLVTEIGVD